MVSSKNNDSFEEFLNNADEICKNILEAINNKPLLEVIVSTFITARNILDHAAGAEVYHSPRMIDLIDDFLKELITKIEASSNESNSQHGS